MDLVTGFGSVEEVSSSIRVKGAEDPAFCDAILVAYFLEILIDNTIARVKWQLMLRTAWVIAGTLGIVNLGVLYYLRMVVVP